MVISGVTEHPAKAGLRAGDVIRSAAFSGPRWLTEAMVSWIYRHKVQLEA